MVGRGYGDIVVLWRCIVFVLGWAFDECGFLNCVWFIVVILRFYIVTGCVFRYVGWLVKCLGSFWYCLEKLVFF